MRRIKLWTSCTAGLLGLLIACAAWAQTDQVTLDVAQDDIGLHGYSRPGTWTPIRIEMKNLGSQPREVIYEWVLKDADGDEIRSSDSVVLTPQSKHFRWLYAVPPLNWNGRDPWKIRLYDKESRQLLAQVEKTPPMALTRAQRSGLSTAVGVIGVTGQGVYNGLSPFNLHYTQHERIEFLRTLDTRKLPDRWYGLSMLQAIIWTPDGASPDHSDILPANRQAVEGWIVRGGHLIVVMEAIGDPWYDSEFADLLPQVDIEDLTDVPRPDFLGAQIPKGEPRRLIMDLHKLTPKPFSSVSIIHEAKINGQDVPLVVSHQVGLGRVTVIGIDLTDKRLNKADLPRGDSKFWQTIFAWRSPGLSAATIKMRKDKPGKNTLPMAQLEHRSTSFIDAFMSEHISMTQTAGGALALAILAFGLYFVLACLVGPIVLKARKLNKHSWMLFGATVLAFIIFTWGGAWIIRPQTNRIKHYSVIAMDAKSNTYHVHSWLKLLYAKHGMVEVKLDAPTQSKGHWNHHTLTSAGVRINEAGAGFIDPQQYHFDSADPTTMVVPMRATAKQFELDFLADVTGAGAYGDHANLPDKWIMPQGKIKVHPNGGLSGTLEHGLPADLDGVYLIYANDPNPNLWRFWRRKKGAAWPANTPWTLPAAMKNLPTGAPRNINLAATPRNKENQYAGALTNAMNATKGYDPENQINNPNSKQNQGGTLPNYALLLSLYDTLPPPKYNNTKWNDTVRHYARNSGRVMDIAKLLPLRKRLILIGILRDVPLPAPLVVEGRTPKSNGVTVVQWIYQIE